jgi:hypothetical protein
MKIPAKLAKIQLTQILAKLAGILPLLPDSGLHRHNSTKVAEILPITGVFCRWYFFRTSQTSENIFR